MYDGYLRTLCVLFALLTAAAAPAATEQAKFDVSPWIEDLHQIRDALSEKYANFEWAVFEREINLTDLFATTEARLRQAVSDEEAKTAIDRMTRTLGDGHVRVRWPRIDTAAPSGASSSPASPDVCRTLGYDDAKSGATLGPYLAGYTPLPGAAAAEFPAGVVHSAGQRIGVIRMGLFDPHGSLALCASALKTLALPAAAPCEGECPDRVEKAAYAMMSSDLANRIRALAKMGATALLIDLTGNGGGSEWAEAAARIISPLSLRSERAEFVRGAHWAENWRSIAQDLQNAEATASDADRVQLERWRKQVEQAEAEAKVSCSSAPFWSGQRPSCEWLGRGFYATGLLGEADAAALKGKTWASTVFTPAEYAFEPAVWHGPLMVLVDGGTGSAAEEFTAVLQDNKAAVIVGAPTAGAGCGHTNGGTPTELTHSHGIFEVPDCVRIRLDGSNEVRGIDPEVLVGFRSNDGIRRKGVRLAAALPQAVSAAATLCRRTHCRVKERPLAVSSGPG